MQNFKDDDVWLLLGDCLSSMRDIPDGYVNTWVTSPPYAKQRDYNGAESKDYSDFILPILKEATRTLADDGSIFLNIKEHCVEGSRDLYVYKMVIDIVEKLGLIFVDEFIWNKTNPFPTGNKKRLKDGFERIYHFTKNKEYKYYPENVLVKTESKWRESELRRKNKGENNVTNGSGMNMQNRISPEMVRPSNVITGSSSCLNIDHPATYPEYLPNFFIKLTTEENDVIGDMFSGSGTTGLAAVKNDRKYIGFEMEEKYHKMGIDRITTANNKFDI